MINRLELQQGTIATHFLEKPRTGMINRLDLQNGTMATHILESHG